MSDELEEIAVAAAMGNGENDISLNGVVPDPTLNKHDYLYALARGSMLLLDGFGMDTRLFRELEIIRYGPSHKWWLSARLLLGLTEAEAWLVREQRTEWYPEPLNCNLHHASSEN